MIPLLAGLVAGAAHVLAGPDHLTAIAPLAVRRPTRAWLPGVRWGLGHSTGVGLVGALAITLRGFIPVEWLSSWGERAVGVMLLGIGLWALRTALRSHIHTHEHEHDGLRHVHIHVHRHGHGQAEPTAHLHAHAAFGIGVLHGLAGSSHFLGVLPALVLPTTVAAATYLVAFAAGTIAAMAGFSWGMGRLASGSAQRGGRLYRGLMGACALAAMGVGGFWLATSF